MWQTALILGLAGSLHCVGMCSPLLLAVTGMRPSAIYNRVIYNVGRLGMYGILGAIVASAGIMLPLHKYQNILSVLLGVLLLIVGMGGVRNFRIPGLSSAILGLSSKLKKMFAAQLKNKSRAGTLILGALNGLLPCGLTFMALTWCLTLRGPLDGLNFMLMFGAGTLPVMLGLTGLLPVFMKKFQWNIHKLTPAILIVSGFVLIARVFIVHAQHVNSGGIVEIMMCR